MVLVLPEPAPARINSGPSPCMAACLWSKLSRVVFASRIEDAERASIVQLPITAVQMKQLARAAVTIEGDVLRAEGIELFKAWNALGGPRRP